MANDLGTQMEQVLTSYNATVNERIAEVTRESMKQLVKETKANAPRGRRKGQYRKQITADYSTLNRRANRMTGLRLSATWYVRAPDYRLTHLLVKGHATKNGDRPTPNPFLQNAVDHIIPEYEQKVQEVLRDGN